MDICVRNFKIVYSILITASVYMHWRTISISSFAVERLWCSFAPTCFRLTKFGAFSHTSFHDLAQQMDAFPPSFLIGKTAHHQLPPILWEPKLAKFDAVHCPLFYSAITPNVMAIRIDSTDFLSRVSLPETHIRIPVLIFNAPLCSGTACINHVGPSRVLS